jgi:hypothetical protein
LSGRQDQITDLELFIRILILVKEHGRRVRTGSEIILIQKDKKGEVVT